MRTATLEPEEIEAIYARLNRLESESEIRRLVSSYHCINDSGSACGVMPAWDLQEPATDGTAHSALEQLRSAAGATWKGHGLSVKGWDHNGSEAVDDGTPRASYMPRMMHFVSNEVIEIQGAEASGSWYCAEPAVVRIDGTEVPVFIAGKCRFDFVLEDSRWKISHAEFTEIFSVEFANPTWLSDPHVAYGPRTTRVTDTAQGTS